MPPVICDSRVDGCQYIVVIYKLKFGLLGSVGARHLIFLH